MIRLVRNGKENGKTAYLAQEKMVGGYMTFASVIFDGKDWVVTRCARGIYSARVDRFAKLFEARNELMKGSRLPDVM